MNYAVMYEFAIDRTSSQFKAPFNQIKNETRVATYRDTAVVTPNSDTPYSLAFMDLRAEPIVLSVPAVDPKRYFSVQLIDGNTYNFGYMGSRTTGSGAASVLVAGPGLDRHRPRRGEAGLPLLNAVRIRHLPHPALRSGRHAER